MADPAEQDRLIGGRHAVNLTRRLPGAGGGLEAFAVRGAPNLMALQVEAGAPPRAGAIARLTHVTTPGILLPAAHGSAPGPDGRDAYFVICTAPPGPALNAANAQWSEAALLEHVLRPAASALAVLEGNQVTHRAIRPDNIFAISAKQPVVLGAAWGAPPACHQPALYEPPYSAMCLPSGRGDGSIADDVYALGIVLAGLAIGRVRLAGLSDVDIVKAKLDLGSFEAVVGDHRLPPILDDLVRGMLAEDPTHRPPPAMLLDTSAARSRRLVVRPPRRARPLQVASIAASDVRGLAHAIAVHPEEGLRLLRGGMIDHWLRRVLRDLPLAARIEEALRKRSGAAGAEEARASGMLAMQVIALLDPLAPLCWHGFALWPSGLGPALAAEQRRPDIAAKLEDLVEQEAVAVWAAARPQQDEAYGLRQDAQQWRSWLTTRANGGIMRLRYELNPLLPCGSPLLAGRWVASVTDLLPGLEAASATPELRKSPPIDSHIAAFISARRDGRLLGEGPVGEGLGADEMPGDSDRRGARGADAALRVQLKVLARLQGRLSPPRPLPGLAAWLAEHAQPLLDSWHNRARRAQVQEGLAAIVRTGQLPALLTLLDDPASRIADRQGVNAAREGVARIDEEIRQIVASGAARRATARRLGHEIAAGLGLTTLAVVLAAVALG